MDHWKEEGRRRGAKENHRLITVLTCRSVIVFARARVIHRTNLLTFIFLRQVIEILHEICDESNLNYFEKVNLCVLVCYKQKICEYRFYVEDRGSTKTISRILNAVLYPCAVD